MPTYASETSVSSEKSRAEIERTLVRYGADEFAYGSRKDRAMVGFVIHDRQIRFLLTMPNRNDREFTHTPARGYRRDDSQIAAAYEQAVRQRWRALALVIKAKLEAVEAGIVTFDEEFAMHMVLPGGQTLGDLVLPQIETAYATGQIPALMPGPGT
jgi:glycogen debranching enzyme